MGHRYQSLLNHACLAKCRLLSQGVSHQARCSRAVVRWCLPQHSSCLPTQLRWSQKRINPCLLMPCAGISACSQSRWASWVIESHLTLGLGDTFPLVHEFRPQNIWRSCFGGSFLPDRVRWIKTSSLQYLGFKILKEQILTEPAGCSLDLSN